MLKIIKGELKNMFYNLTFNSINSRIKLISYLKARALRFAKQFHITCFSWFYWQSREPFTVSAGGETETDDSDLLRADSGGPYGAGTENLHVYSWSLGDILLALILVDSYKIPWITILMIKRCLILMLTWSGLLLLLLLFTNLWSSMQFVINVELFSIISNVYT